MFKLFLSLNRSEQVKVHLQNYFEKSRRAVSGIDQGLCLLCVQCFEVCASIVIVLKQHLQNCMFKWQE